MRGRGKEGPKSPAAGGHPAARTRFSLSWSPPDSGPFAGAKGTPMRARTGRKAVLALGFLLLLAVTAACSESAYEQAEAYFEQGNYDRAIESYDEAIRLERQEADAYYKRGLAHEALGKAKEASRDFEKAIQEYDEDIRRDPQPYAYYQRALAYEALGKTIEAARDFAEAKELGYDDDGSQSTGLLEAAPEASNFQIFLDDFTKTIEVAPLVLEGELSRDDTVTSWSFEGNEGQILQFELRPESGSHVDFGHVQIRLSLVDDERLQTADPEVIGKDEELEEIALPETGTYTLEVEGNIDETSGAYVITISGQ